MACTIDHLRVDHRVTVVRAFTDLDGIHLREGDTAVIRGMGADYARMELWIELERDGSRHRFRFALRAKDGPRNGRMRDYFEMGESADAPPVPAPPAPEPTETPRTPEPPFRGPPERQLPEDSSLGGLRVGCGCNPGFHRDLVSARGSLSVAACLRCGTVTCTRSFGDDGRFTGQAWQETRSVTLPEPVHAWLSGWPRVKIEYAGNTRWPMSADYVRYPTLYYPADLRVADLLDLPALEAKLAREQAAQSMAARLRSTLRVTTAPPAGIPEDLTGYLWLWTALQLRGNSTLDDLIHHARPRSPGCLIAAEWVRERPDAFEIVRDLLQSNDPTRQGTGFMIARDMRPADPRMAGLLMELMAGFSLQPCPEFGQGVVSRGQFERVFLLIADLELATPEVLSALKAVMRKLARHDPFLVDCVRIVINELNRVGQPAGPAG